MSAFLVVLVPAVLAVFAMQMERLEGVVMRDKHTEPDESLHDG